MSGEEPSGAWQAGRHARQVAVIGAGGCDEGSEVWTLAEEVGAAWPRPARRSSAAAAAG